MGVGEVGGGALCLVMENSGKLTVPIDLFRWLSISHECLIHLVI